MAQAGIDIGVELAPPPRMPKAERERNNNNNLAERANINFRQHPMSPIATRAMAPNPKLSYVDRVVMEIIETERMYVQDLRSIIEVGKLCCTISTYGINPTEQEAN